MTVKRVKPKELPQDIIFNMNYLFKTTLDDFVIMVNNKQEIVYVNESIPQSDVDDFIKYITFEGDYVNDYKAGLGKMLDAIYDKYGSNVHSVLLDAYDYRKKKQKEQRAKEAAKVILAYRLGMTHGNNNQAINLNLTVECEGYQLLHIMQKLDSEYYKQSGRHVFT